MNKRVKFYVLEEKASALKTRAKETNIVEYFMVFVRSNVVNEYYYTKKGISVSQACHGK